MKSYIFLALLFLTVPASALTRIWIFAPELSSQKSVVDSNSSGEIEKILNSSGVGSFSVKIMNVEEGRATAWSLRNDLESPADFIFYYLPARDIPRELAEVLSYQYDDDNRVISPIGKDGFCEAAPELIQKILPRDLCVAVGRSVVFKKKIQKMNSVFLNRDKEQLYLSASFVGLDKLFLKLGSQSQHKSESLCLISPERIEYFSDAFDSGSIEDSVSTLLTPELSIPRKQFKIQIDSSLVETVPYKLLSAKFYDLYRAENVVSGSRRVLNSVGVKEWTGLMGNYLLEYMKLRLNSKSASEKNSKIEPVKKKR
ncbi:MAG: hypothetical protein ACM3MG_11255 [Bacillota bacterium]